MEHRSPPAEPLEATPGVGPPGGAAHLGEAVDHRRVVADPREQQEAMVVGGADRHLPGVAQVGDELRHGGRIPGQLELPGQHVAGANREHRHGQERPVAGARVFQQAEQHLVDRAVAAGGHHAVPRRFIGGHRRDPTGGVAGVLGEIELTVDAAVQQLLHQPLRAAGCAPTAGDGVGQDQESAGHLRRYVWGSPGRCRSLLERSPWERWQAPQTTRVGS